MPPNFGIIPDLETKVRNKKERYGVYRDRALAALQIWMEENLEGYPAGLNYSVLDYTNSVNRLKLMRDIENAKLWFGHSSKQYDAMGNKWHK